MPNCYQYWKNGEPVKLAPLDDAICREVLGREPDAKVFAPEFEWGVSFRIATGRTLQEIVQNDGDAPAGVIAQWLIDNGYTTDAWVQ